MRQLKNMAALATAIGALSGMAADTHDYSSYARLKADTTVTAGYPAADQWEPASDMANGGNFLVPSGKTLTSKNSQTSVGGVWPADELAIEGTYYPRISNNYSYAPTITNIALLAGGSIQMSTKYSAVYGQTLDIRGTAEKPSCIWSDFKYENTTHYPHLFSVFTCSDADKFVFIRPKGFKVTRSVESIEGGKILLSATIAKQGFAVISR